jgi:hypothetical protein
MLRSERLLRLLASLLLLSRLSLATDVRLYVGGTLYEARLAEFGNQLTEEYDRSGVLMRPSENDKFLCQFPDGLEDATINFQHSLGLLISLDGGCSILDKAQVALSLNRKFSDDIRHVVIYNSDFRSMNVIPQLTSTEADNTYQYQNISFVSVSAATGAALQAEISSRATATGRNPNLAPRTTAWDLWFSMQPVLTQDDLPPQSSNNNSNDSGEVSFFFFVRFFLFGLFLVLPCMRAAYLWRAGGGSIQWRRNQRGYVIGLRYVSPEPYWYISNPVRRSQQRQAVTERENRQLLTEEQLMALPELIFPGAMFQTNDDKPPSEQEAEKTEMSEEGLEETAHDQEGAHSTTCTTCSICIEDFEAGERIRILPKCKHAYHTDCLLPWLTERHGSCPLCKEKVLDDKEGENNNNDEERESQSPLQAEQDSMSGIADQELVPQRDTASEATSMV